MKNENMFLNVKIKGLGTYLPGEKVGNEPYIEYFKTLGKDITDTLKQIRRKYRYVSKDLNENSITMGVEASFRAMKIADVKPEEIDLLIFATNTPEFTTPTNAIKAHNLLGTTNAHIVYDINADCLGAILAMQQANLFMKANRKIRKALIIASFMISPVSKKDDLMSHATGSDSASAIILEAVEEPFERGILNSSQYANSTNHAYTQNPYCGFSNFYRTDIDKEEAKWVTLPIDAGQMPYVWSSMINKVLAQRDMKPKDVDFFIFSQFVEPPIVKTLELLQVEDIPSKYNYVSEEIGYTGVNCELFALEDAMKNGHIKEGSNVIISAIGVGMATMAFLYKF